MKRLDTKYYLLAVGLLQLTCITPIADAATRRALIITPGGYTELTPGAFFDAGANALREQLLSSGFLPENLILLSSGGFFDDHLTTQLVFEQLDELVQASRPDDLLVVAIAGYGVHLAGRDYITLAHTQLSEIEAVASAHEELAPQSLHLLSIQKFIETMSISTGQKLLIIDAAGTRSPVRDGQEFLPGTLALQSFGDEVLQLGNSTWTICNRSGRLTEGQENSHVMTRFMRSILEGLALHADANNDRAISLLEIVDYLQRFAEGDQSIPPVFQGKLSVDFEIAKTTREAGSDALPPAVRKLLYRNMRELALAALIVEQDAKVALDALARAQQYALEPELQAELDGLKLTALAGSGKLRDAWETANRQGRELLVVVSRPHEVYKNPVGTQVTQQVLQGRRYVNQTTLSDPVTGNLPVGTLVRIAEINQDRIRFDLAFERQGTDRDIQFAPYENLSGWLKLSAPKSGSPQNSAMLTTGR